MHNQIPAMNQMQNQDQLQQQQYQYSYPPQVYPQQMMPVYQQPQQIQIAPQQFQAQQYYIVQQPIQIQQPQQQQPPQIHPVTQYQPVQQPIVVNPNIMIPNQHQQKPYSLLRESRLKKISMCQLYTAYSMVAVAAFAILDAFIQLGNETYLFETFIRNTDGKIYLVQLGKQALIVWALLKITLSLVALSYGYISSRTYEPIYKQPSDGDHNIPSQPSENPHVKSQQIQSHKQRVIHLLIVLVAVFFMGLLYFRQFFKNSASDYIDYFTAVQNNQDLKQIDGYGKGDINITLITNSLNDTEELLIIDSNIEYDQQSKELTKSQTNQNINICFYTVFALGICVMGSIGGCCLCLISKSHDDQESKEYHSAFYQQQRLPVNLGFKQLPINDLSLSTEGNIPPSNIARGIPLN